MRIRDVLAELVDRADGRVVESLYVAVSVPTERVRTQLRQWGHPFIDPKLAEPPEMAELERTAEWVIHQASSTQTALGGFAGLAGAASVPPEVLATTIHTLRLAQRLAIIYGFDPDTDRGQMALWRALAAAYEFELPDRGLVGLRLRELPSLFPVSTPEPRSVGAKLATQMVRRTAWMVAGRVTRFVPVLSAGWAAAGARKRMAAMGGRMSDTLSRMADAPSPYRLLVEDAVEVGR
jgi:hypothetical protein